MVRGAGLESSKPSPPLRYGERLIEEKKQVTRFPPSTIGSMSPSLTIRGVEVLDVEDEMASFRRFLSVKKNLTKKVVTGHCNSMKKFLQLYHGVVSSRTVEEYLERVKRQWKLKTYANHLGSMNRYIRDFKGLSYVDDYEFPDIPEMPIVIPSKEELREFFHVLPECERSRTNERMTSPKYKAIFLFFASSGLRFGEVISLRRSDIDSEKRMIIPKSHETYTTKNSWVSFYNRETAEYLTWLEQLAPEDRIFPAQNSVYRAFKYARGITDLHITPQNLREWFCEEMGEQGVSDRYIDAFCGRTPKSMLSRRYTDYSPKKLRAIYERANLRIL